jgi:hypothetical protein
MAPSTWRTSTAVGVSSVKKSGARAGTTVADSERAIKCAGPQDDLRSESQNTKDYENTCAVADTLSSRSSNRLTLSIESGFRRDNQAFRVSKEKPLLIRPLHGGAPSRFTAAAVLGLVVHGLLGSTLSRVSEALALAQDLGHPYTIAFAHYMTSVVHLLRVDAARPWKAPTARSFEISQEQRFSLYVKIENFARPRPLVADFETSRNRIPPRGQASYAPGAVLLLLTLRTLTPMAQQDKILNPRPQGRRHLCR